MARLVGLAKFFAPRPPGSTSAASAAPHKRPVPPGDAACAGGMAQGSSTALGGPAAHPALGAHPAQTVPVVLPPTHSRLATALGISGLGLGGAVALGLIIGGAVLAAANPLLGLCLGIFGVVLLCVTGGAGLGAAGMAATARQPRHFGLRILEVEVPAAPAAPAQQLAASASQASAVA